MRTPHDAVLQTKYNKLISIIEKYDLLDLWEDMVADLDGLELDISQCMSCTGKNKGRKKNASII